MKLTRRTLLLGATAGFSLRAATGLTREVAEFVVNAKYSSTSAGSRSSTVSVSPSPDP
jgi:hypothetical protein